ARRRACAPEGRRGGGSRRGRAPEGARRSRGAPQGRRGRGQEGSRRGRHHGAAQGRGRGEAHRAQGRAEGGARRALRGAQGRQEGAAARVLSPLAFFFADRVFEAGLFRPAFAFGAAFSKAIVMACRRVAVSAAARRTLVAPPKPHLPFTGTKMSPAV